MPFKEQLARAKARSAFLRLVRRGLALATLAVVLHQQAFMVRRRQKVVPLHLAVSGAVAWAGDYSPSDGGTSGGDRFNARKSVHVQVNEAQRRHVVH